MKKAREISSLMSLFFTSVPSMGPQWLNPMENYRVRKPVHMACLDPTVEAEITLVKDRLKQGTNGN